MMTATDRRGHLRAIWTALFVTMLWSSSWVLIRIVLDDDSLAPITFAGLRYGLAAMVLCAWTLSRSRHRRALTGLDRASIGRLVLLGVVFVSVTQGAQFVAIGNQPAASTSLVLSLTPFVVAVLAVRTLGERSTRRQFVGAALVAVGAAMYLAGDLGATAVGMTAACVALVANSAGSMLGRHINRDPAPAPVVVTTVSMSVGAIVLLVVGCAVEGWPRLTVTSAAVIGWLAVVNTALAFTLWNASLRRLTAVESSAVNNTMLIQIALLAWVFLGEAPGPVGLIGIVTVSAGVFLAQTVLVRPSTRVGLR
jgi:drug/metabolite transporter (DMT)-like permease